MAKKEKPYRYKSSTPLHINLKKNAALYLMVLPGVVLILIFSYFPMYGIVMAFQNFRPLDGFFGSQFVGLRHFRRLFEDLLFRRAFMNTLWLGVLSIVFTFPAPILLALSFNELKHNKYKRVAQTISYMPHFLSAVIVVGFLMDMLTVDGGVVNIWISALGFERINFFLLPEWFRPLFIGTSIWQGVGFSSIIYLAAIAGINPELYESADIDGGNRFQKAVYITIPSIMPTIVILFIFAMGGILGNDWQRILLMYNPAIFSTADVVGTYVYRIGIEGGHQSYAAAVGFTMSVISAAFLVATNYTARRLGETSLW
ncbi:MAG: ABC transporter permease subunit [Defluviitaleaceae bacterium]|nr:ABC transporter permease subunit [Defluviitaleaceae bacterium]